MKKCIIVMDEEWFNRLGNQALYTAELIATYEEKEPQEENSSMFHVGNQCGNIEVDITKSRYPRKDSIRNKIIELAELIEQEKGVAKDVIWDSLAGHEEPVKVQEVKPVGFEYKYENPFQDYKNPFQNGGKVDMNIPPMPDPSPPKPSLEQIEEIRKMLGL